MTTNALAPRAPVMAMGSLQDPAELGRVLAASGYFSDVREAAQAVVKVLAGAELGFGPIASMTGVYIVKGRVTLSANLMAAAIKRHPAYDYRIGQHTDTRAVIAYLDANTPCSKCKGTGVQPDTKNDRCAACFGSRLDCIGQSEFTMDNARTAGLAGGENWKKYPANMLLWRAMSNGAKFFCPDAFSGAPVYTPDELGADVDGESGDVVELSTPVAAQTTPPPVPPPSEAPANDAPDTANRPGGATENVAPPAPAAVEEPAQDAPPPAQENGNGDPRADLAALLERVRTDANGGQLDTAVRMAFISYNVQGIADLSDMQAREVMGRVLQRFGGQAT